uniref:Uncharacterized protein n=1 Tax=Lepeophtheirus salmonis TaxID=72036 RepID=A0A0K2TPG0_LEPSM
MVDSKIQTYEDVLHEIITLVDTFERKNSDYTHSHTNSRSKSSVLVSCHICSEELSGKCLLQACGSPSSSSPVVRDDQTKCRDCGKELSAKCILAICNNKQPSSTSLQLAH